MNNEYPSPPDNPKDWICPDIRTYWQLAKRKDSDEVILKATQENRQYRFSRAEGYALLHFIGEFTVEQIQNNCQQEFKDTISPNLVVELLQKLITLGILEFPTVEESPQASSTNVPRLKACVQWIHNPDGYWILRNPEDVKFMQVSDRDREVILQFGQLPLPDIAEKYNISKEEMQYLWRLLTATAMIEGTKPPKHPKGKFNPLKLLSFKFSLFNPDAFLMRHVDKLRWIWTTTFCCIVCFFLAWSALVGVSESREIFLTGQQMWTSQGGSVIIPFALLMMLVVSLHEFAHAFTLKHYGGIVPEIGLLFMCLMPGCYTDTSDAYCLVKRRQRALVVAAGVLCQLIIWAIALWLWNLSNPDTWLHTTSYLLMVAALFTVALNLNPMSKFDGYYLTVAISGIFNLRSRSFQFYQNLLRMQPSPERPRDAFILAIYAPFSFAYILVVFGHLWLGLGDWLLSNIPMMTLTILVLWLIYFFLPSNKKSVQ